MVHKLFTLPPYKKCPRCSGDDTYGINMNVGKLSYQRQCFQCHFEMVMPLPKLDKKIVYIDQNGISEMMKVLNPHSKSHHKKDQLKAWRELFVNLYKAIRAQLIICPRSGYHHLESSLIGVHRALEQVRDILSEGAAFKWEQEIEREQVLNAFHRWIRPDDPVPVTSRRRMIRGEIDRWSERMLVTVASPPICGLAEEVRDNKRQTTKGIRELFPKWQKENKSFDEHYNMELATCGEGILRSVLKERESFSKSMCGEGPIIEPGDNLLNFNIIFQQLQEEGLDPESAIAKAAEFFRSDFVKQLPFNHITALLFAALAEKAKSGMKAENLKESFCMDVQIVSHLLPYCDVIILDNELASLLNSNQVRTRLGFSTRIFSKASHSEFYVYLQNLYQQMSSDHQRILEDLYSPVTDNIDWISERFEKIDE